MKRLYFFAGLTGSAIITEREFAALSEHVTLEGALYRTCDNRTELEGTQPLEPIIV